MAVDRQKIINDLGNIVNQLQSADCGCLGNVFSNPNSGQGYQPPAQYPDGYQGGGGFQDGFQGGCQGSHQNNSPCAGEPCPGAKRCMGFCNPTKLFADTYNYLQPNLMQPVIQEVYNDLKSINPQNTVMNSVTGAQMGLPAGTQNAPQGNQMSQNSMPGGPMANTGGAMGNVNGMPHIMNMHGQHQHMPHLHFGDVDMNSMNQQQGMGAMGQGTDQPSQGFGQASQGYGQTGQGMGQPGLEMAQMGQTGQEMGAMEQSMGHQMVNMRHDMGHTGYMDQGMGQMKQGMSQMEHGMGPGIAQGMGHGMHRSGGMAGMGPQIANMMHSSSKPHYQHNHGGRRPNVSGNAMQQPPEMGQPRGEANQGQYNAALMQNTDYMGGNNLPQRDTSMQGNQIMTQPNMNANAQDNVMPGDMKQMDARSQRMGNMNDYGVHNAGMAKFNEMFSGMMKEDLGFDPMAIAIQMNPANEKRSAMDAIQNVMTGDRRHHPRVGQLASQPVNSPRSNLSASLKDMMSAPNQQQQLAETTGRAPTQNNQQIYNAQAATPTMNQQPPPQINTSEKQLLQQHWQQPSQEPLGQTEQKDYQQKQMVDPKSEGDVSRLPTVYEGYPNVRTQHGVQTVQHLYREPIFPADTSRHLLQSHHFSKPQNFFDYNTLGQPVEIIPAKRYRIPIPDLPQTLSPEPNAGRYSNVKNTVSKTSLMGNKPEGKMPSRTQLQHLYNQYKGSQSFTQQNIRPVHTGSSSAGNINVRHEHRHHYPPHQVHIEKVGGDTEANNHIPTKLDPLSDQGFAATKKPDCLPIPKNFKLRNGLQDQAYTSPPTSAKWTFHGTGNAPFSTGYRYRTR